jgi:methyltransferase (TIGR00027 family)
MFTSLKRVTYQVPDIEKARRWYGELLKIEPVLDAPFIVMFVIGDAVLTLVPNAAPLPKSDERMVAYWGVEDVDAAYRRLLEMGATPHTTISTALDVRLAKVVDPFGNILGITGKVLDAEKTSVENQPSESAMTVAFCRALAAAEEREELRGPDYLAHLFLREDGQRALKDRAYREWVLQKRVPPALYGYFIARTAYMDQVFAEALQDNIPQIVFLGAGYDTRSYRFRESIKNTRIFELDVQSTQQRKRDLLNAANVPVPEQLTFLTINFRTETLQDALLQAGFDRGKKTLFIWEGVMYYLPAEAVNDTLSFIKSNSPAGSTLCFDYLIQPVPSTYAGEPFLFWIGKREIEPFLSERGYRIVEHLAAEDMERRYLALRDGSTGGKVFPLFCFVQASVTG